MEKSGRAPGWGCYAEVFRTPGVLRLVTSMTVGRLPNGMLPLILIVFMHRQLGSYTEAGVVTAGYTVGVAASAPARGRTLDRFGKSPVLTVLATLQTLVLAGILAAAWSGLGLPVLLALAVAVGATNSTSGAAMRSLWRPVLADERLLSTAYALQATAEDILQVVGPLLGGVILALWGATPAIAVSAALNLAGVLVFATAPACRASGAGQRGGRGRERVATSTPGLLTLTLAAVFAGVAIGVLQVALPVFTQAHGTPSGAGLLLAMVAFGSITSGLVYGSRSWPGSATHRYLAITGLFAVLFAPLAFVHSVPVMAVLLFFTGFGYSPRNAAAYLLLDDVVRPEASAEAYTWIISGVATGVAAGTALTGFVAEHAGLTWTFLTAFGTAAAGFAVVSTRIPTLAAIRPPVPMVAAER